jgi:hypothetical protein
MSFPGLRKYVELETVPHLTFPSKQLCAFQKEPQGHLFHGLSVLSLELGVLGKKSIFLRICDDC